MANKEIQKLLNSLNINQSKLKELYQHISLKYKTVSKSQASANFYFIFIITSQSISDIILSLSYLFNKY